MSDEFERLGGRLILEKVSKVFYDKVYADPWIGKFFEHVPQERIESQQVDFMQGALGGPQDYCGRLPIPAHQHMYITAELFQLREDYLLEALHECNASEELIKKWLKVDNAFKDKLVKKNLGDCEKRFFTDDILSFPKPHGHKKVA